jgi:allantoin racemase
MPKIAYIDPVGPEGACYSLKKGLEGIKQKETKVDFIHLNRGPRHLEYRYYESLIIPDLLHTIKNLEKKGYDAAIIGCFYDPGILAAREIANRIIVTAPAEASLNLAATLGYKFSIIVGRGKWIPRIMENIEFYGLKNKLASFKILELGALEFYKDEVFTKKKLKEKAIEAVEKDRAEVIVLGCTMQFGFYKELQEHMKVPVIDPVIASFKYAEYLVELRDRFGWQISKRYTFESPPFSEIRKWKLDQQYF